jgi:hypothetical protein
MTRDTVVTVGPRHDGAASGGWNFENGEAAFRAPEKRGARGLCDGSKR